MGAYVTFVRDRERLEKRFGYTLASIFAGVKTLKDLRSFSVTLDVDGKTRTFRTSLVFIGVGERELKMPTLGSRVENGRRGLHVMIVRGRARARLFTLALSAIARGTKETSKLPEFENFLVDKCQIDLNRPHATIGLDGELKQMATPLEYRLEPDALRLVVAPPEKNE
jgi:diacylglycerol kinase family enzyme